MPAASYCSNRNCRTSDGGWPPTDRKCTARAWPRTTAVPEPCGGPPGVFGGADEGPPAAACGAWRGASFRGGGAAAGAGCGVPDHSSEGSCPGRVASPVGWEGCAPSRRLGCGCATPPFVALVGADQRVPSHQRRRPPSVGSGYQPAAGAGRDTPAGARCRVLLLMRHLTGLGCVMR